MDDELPERHLIQLFLVEELEVGDDGPEGNHICEKYQKECPERNLKRPARD